MKQTCSDGACSRKYALVHLCCFPYCTRKHRADGSGGGGGERERRALEADLQALARETNPQDPSLQRTFGEKSKVRDHDWSYLSQLRTLRKPHEPMARLAELLEYLNEPGLEDTWAILDVKVSSGNDTQAAPVTS